MRKHGLAILAILFIASGCTKEGPVGPPGSSGDSDLMDPTILPKVISTLPASGAIGPFDLFNPGSNPGDPNFLIQFNKLINTDQFGWDQKTVTVQGFARPVIVRLYMIYFPWVYINAISNGPYANVLAFNIYDSAGYYGRIPYGIGNSYTVSVDTSLEDVNGNHLALPHRFSFVPEPYFRVASFYPAQHSTNNPPGTTPTVTFNSAVDAGILPYVHMSPTSNGTWELSPYDSMSVIFPHSDPLVYNAAYVISVDAGAHDAAGHPIHASEEAAFTIIPFEVSYTYPADGSTFVDPSTTIQATLTGSADTASIRAAFSISPSTQGTLYVSQYGFSFSPLSSLLPGTLYTVTLSTVLQSIEGVHLGAPYRFSFKTRG